MLPENTTPSSTEMDEDPKKTAENGTSLDIQTHTRIPNAHASGLGAMGRNDEKLPTSPEEDSDRPEAAY